MSQNLKSQLDNLTVNVRAISADDGKKCKNFFQIVKTINLVLTILHQICEKIEELEQNIELCKSPSK